MDLPPRIFLAHATEDKNKVKVLYRKLRGAGFAPWLSDYDLIAGQNWRDVIPEVIQECDIFIACFSEQSVRKQGYVQREYKLALDTYAEKPPGKIYLIPIKLDDCDIPNISTHQPNVNLRDFQWIEYWKKDGFDRLLKAIKSHLVSDLIVSTSHRATDWKNPVVTDFLERSDLNLFSIDTAVANWLCPKEETDWGWKDNNDILLTIEKNLIDESFPDQLKQIAQEYKIQHHDKADSVRYCVTEFTIEPPDSRGRLKMICSPITYLTAQPIMDSLMNLDSGQRLRTTWFQRLQSRSRPLVPNTLDIQILIITGDNQLLLLRRREDKELDFMRGRWSASIEEQLNADWLPFLKEDEVFHLARVPDHSIFEGFHRALREEAKLDLSEVRDSKLRILATGFDCDCFGTSLYAMAELPEYLTCEKLVPRLSSHEEFDAIAWCSFDPETLLPILLNSSPPANARFTGKGDAREWRWHSSSRLRIALGLRRRIGESGFRKLLGA